MKKSHQYKWVTLLFGMAVFCFWFFVRPAQVVERESFQLFLYNSDYLMERMALPGGMARYVGEFLVQFFRFVALGALLSALLLVAVHWLSWLLLQRSLQSVGKKILFVVSFLPSIALCYLLCDMDVSMTLPIALLLTLGVMLLLPNKKTSSLSCTILLVPVGYWLVGPMIVLLPIYHLRWLSQSNSKIAIISQSVGMTLLVAACIIVSSYFVPYSLQNLAKGLDYQMIQRSKIGTYEEMEYDYLLRLKQWEKIVRKSNAQVPQSLACKNTVRMAKFYLNQISDEELKENLLKTDRVMTNGVSAVMMSDIYLHMGFVNMSQRAAFEVMESASNYNMSGRALARLIETNLVTGQYGVALKYISILEDSLLYRHLAQQMRELATHPEKINEKAVYKSLQEVYGQTVDVLFF